MKTRMSQLVVALIFVTLFAVNAKATKHDVKASSHENTEVALEFENWMMDENVWSTGTAHYAEVTEPGLELESWMTIPLVWDFQTKDLALEEWMTDEKVWDAESPITIETETEKDLTMEYWMVNRDIWN